jgi:hypothetical protein
MREGEAIELLKWMWFLHPINDLRGFHSSPFRVKTTSLGIKVLDSRATQGCPMMYLPNKNVFKFWFRCGHATKSRAAWTKKKIA